MAKGNMLLGYARGKVGDLVFKRVDGKQVTTPRVRVVKNPRTDAQTINRIAFASASKTAQHLRGIVDHSFQGIKYGSTSVNYFVSQLTKELASDIKAALVGLTSADPYGCAPVLPNAATSVACGAAILVSKGDLVGINASYDSAVKGLRLAGGYAEPSSTTTVAQFCEMLGIPTTDQITILQAVVEELDYISDEELFYGVRYDYMRINWAEDAGNTPAFINGAHQLNPAVIDLSRSDARCLDLHFEYVAGYLYVGRDWTAGSLSFAYDCFGRDANKIASVGVIMSRYDAGAWRRSTCRMALNPSVAASFVGKTEGLGWNDIDSIMALSQPTKQVTEAEYLNKEKKNE